MLNAKGESYISYADYAIAVIDEIENPQHVNERFTVVAEAE
jgi:putative NADH-flavin reductase